MRQLTLERNAVWTVAAQLPDGIIEAIAKEFEADIRRCLHEDLEEYHARKQAQKKQARDMLRWFLVFWVPPLHNTPYLC